MNNTFINGIRVFSFSSRNELIEYVAKEKKSLIAINAEKILHSNKEVIKIINQNIGYADGIGAVWALKKKGYRNTIKIPGCELWLDITNHFANEKSFYLVGSRDEIISQTIEKLKIKFPMINIVGFRNGYIKTEKEKIKLMEDIIAKKPDIVFIAMGSPKQELLLGEMQKIHSAIYQGLGGSFDVFVGKRNRAPQWWLENNLEWAYRLIKQPKRIWRQIHLVKFFVLLYINRF